MGLKPLLRFVVLVLTLTGTTAQTADPRDKTFPPIDFERWAQFIVRDFFDVQPYERVVYIADPSYYRMCPVSCGNSIVA